MFVCLLLIILNWAWLFKYYLADAFPNLFLYFYSVTFKCLLSVFLPPPPPPPPPSLSLIPSSLLQLLNLYPVHGRYALPWWAVLVPLLLPAFLGLRQEQETEHRFYTTREEKMDRFVALVFFYHFFLFDPWVCFPHLCALTRTHLAALTKKKNSTGLLFSYKVLDHI